MANVESIILLYFCSSARLFMAKPMHDYFLAKAVMTPTTKIVTAGITQEVLKAIALKIEVTDS